MSNNEISIEGLDKAEVLAALYNGSQQLGMGFFHERGKRPMTVEEAKQELARGDDHDQMFGREPRRMYFDYLHGRVLKVDIGGDILRTALYNRDNGSGAAEKIIKKLRDGK